MSLFSEALRRLLDETRQFDRGEWAKFLGTQTARVERWLADEEIPRPMALQMICILLEETSGVPREPLEAFRRTEKMRATHVSPHGARMLPTVEEYRKRPAFSALSNRLAPLSPAEQATFLLEMYPEYPHGREEDSELRE